MRQFQTTLAKKATLSGVGLHSGKETVLEIMPADADHGIYFLRSDIDGAKPIKAVATNISKTTLNTAIGNGENSVSTIEHLMAAFVGVGIDNVLVKVDGPEIPILDGSAQPFFEAFSEVGIVSQEKELVYFKIKNKLEIAHGDQFFRIEPSDSLEINCTIDFEDSIIGKQSILYQPSSHSFKDLAMARTFCRLEDVNKMRSIGLALGGTLDNAIVISDKEGIMNEEGLRVEKEFVKHKLLDLIGDIHLLGAPIIAKIETCKPGHTIHAEVTKKALNSFDQYFDKVTISSMS